MVQIWKLFGPPSAQEPINTWIRWELLLPQFSRGFHYTTPLFPVSPWLSPLISPTKPQGSPWQFPRITGPALCPLFPEKLAPLHWGILGRVSLQGSPSYLTFLLGSLCFSDLHGDCHLPDGTCAKDSLSSSRMPGTRGEGDSSRPRDWYLIAMRLPGQRPFLSYLYSAGTETILDVGTSHAA